MTGLDLFYFLHKATVKVKDVQDSLAHTTFQVQSL